MPARDAAARAGWLARLGAVTVLAVLACGAVVAAHAATGGSPAGRAAVTSSTLCTRPAAARRVVLTRTASPGETIPPVQTGPLAPSSPQAPSGAAGQSGRPAAAPAAGTGIVARTVVTARQAVRLARALCALPRLPKGPVNCPDFLAGRYQLSFTAAGRRLPAITVSETGCQTVTGLGAVRTASGRPAFWVLLAASSGPAPVRPVHLPVLPGAPVVFSPAGGCRPASTRIPAAFPSRTCPGPDRPVALPGGPVIP